MISFANPWFFILLLAVGAAGLWFFLQKEKIIPTLQVSTTALFPSPPWWQQLLLHLPLLLKLAALILVVFALARPQIANTKIRQNVQGIDIVIALDISDSMLIEDMKPLNRLEAAKETIKNFIAKRTSDRIGLVIFAGESFTQVPPTLDYPILLQRVDEITTAASANIKDGTAIGVAMASAAGRLKDSTAKTRVIIFMTDGENNSGTIDPETGLEIAKGYGLKVYSIGMGRDGPTKLPIYQKDVFGQRIKNYVPFESTVNEDLLKLMASSTGGKFYRASKEDSLTGIFNDIDQLEKTKIDVNKYTKYSENFYWYLGLALILYLTSIVLNMTILRRWP
ncbi:MAG: VWA domain-containing protein [Pseudobdellovibrionaceae bacterium]